MREEPSVCGLSRPAGVVQGIASHTFHLLHRSDRTAKLCNLGWNDASSWRLGALALPSVARQGSSSRFSPAWAEPRDPSHATGLKRHDRNRCRQHEEGQETRIWTPATLGHGVGGMRARRQSAPVISRAPARPLQKSLFFSFSFWRENGIPRLVCEG